MLEELKKCLVDITLMAIDLEFYRGQDASDCWNLACEAECMIELVEANNGHDWLEEKVICIKNKILKKTRTFASVFRKLTEEQIDKIDGTLVVTDDPDCNMTVIASHTIKCPMNDCELEFDLVIK